MILDHTLQLRRSELRRRAEAMPAEVAAWQKRVRDGNELDLNAHNSQLVAIKTMIDVLAEDQRVALDGLDAAGAAHFPDEALTVVRGIIKSQKIWGFFRDKLELRLSPAKDALWTADTIAWDCYRPVLEDAANAGIIRREHLREPPLTYLAADFSPATWVRGSRPNDGRNYHLGTAGLPIPIIEMPWDHLENLWELGSLLHEVGHDLEADLKLRGPLQAALRARLTAGGVPTARIDRWIAWEGEVFADLIALRLGGPAFADSLMHLLILPRAQVTTIDDDDPHPTHYVRILLNCHYARALLPGEDSIGAQVSDTLAAWQGLYGAQAALAEFADDFTAVCAGLMHTALNALQGRSVADLVPFTLGDDQTIRRAAAYMRTGQNKPARIRPRHCVSAARIAASHAVSSPAAGEVLGDALNTINKRMMALVRENAPQGLRAGDNTAPHRQFVAALTRALPDDISGRGH